jgi:hypothetical protein
VTRLLVCGSRGYPLPGLVESRVSGYPPGTVLIVGGARGPDVLAETIGRERGYDVRVFLPDWDAYGRGAGYRRNADMITELEQGDPDDDRLVIAFHDGKSRGTAHTIKEARRRAIPLEVWGPDGGLRVT